MTPIRTKLHIPLAAFALVCISACSRQADTGMMALFENKIEPVSVRKFETLETDSVRTPYMMACLNNEILFADIYLGTLVSAFDKNSGKWLYYALSRGNGPDEYIQPTNMGAVDDKLFIWDAGQSVLALLDIGQGSFRVEKQIAIRPDSSLIAAFQLTPVSEDYYVASGIIKGHRLAIIDQQGKLCTAFGSYPFTKSSTENDTEPAFANQGAAVYQPAKHRFAISNLMGESISFYDLSDIHQPKICKAYNCVAPQYRKTADGSIAFTKDNKLGFVALAASADYCIGLFRGEASQSPQDYGGNKLLFFDWDGNPIKAYTLSDYYTYLAIDEESKRILLLGIDAQTQDYKLDIVATPSEKGTDLW